VRKNDSSVVNTDNSSDKTTYTTVGTTAEKRQFRHSYQLFKNALTTHECFKRINKIQSLLNNHRKFAAYWKEDLASDSVDTIKLE
jgi:hypothetical protein